VKKKYSDYFGADKEAIEIFTSENEPPFMGYINRRAQSNNSPRIMGGTKLRDWFQNNFRELDVVKVEVISPVSIYIHK